MGLDGLEKVAIEGTKDTEKNDWGMIDCKAVEDGIVMDN